MEDTELATKALRIENKNVFLNLRQNNRGLYLKIAEKAGVSRNSIIVPATGLHALRDALDALIAENKIPDGLPGPQRTLEVPRSAAASNGNAGLSKRVYVGNLTFDCTAEELELHMAHCGKVKNVEILTSTSGRSRGAGVVEYETVEEALAAIKGLNRSELHGRILQVREDREAHVQPTHEGNRLFVGNLSWNLQNDVLKSKMEEIGPVQSCEVMYQSTGRSRGYAIVVYENTEDAKRAINTLNGALLDEREMQVRYDRH